MLRSEHTCCVAAMPAHAIRDSGLEARDSNSSNPWLLTRATQAQNTGAWYWISGPLYLTGWDEDYWRWLYCRLTASETKMEPRPEQREVKG